MCDYVTFDEYAILESLSIIQMSPPFLLICSNTAYAHIDKNAEEKFFPRLHSFCVGLPDSPDLAAAAKVAASLGTIHHSYTYTIQEVNTLYLLPRQYILVVFIHF